MSEKDITTTAKTSAARQMAPADVFASIEKTEENPQPLRQLWLFEEYKQYFPKENKTKDSLKMFHFAKNLFLGMSAPEAYQKSYDTQTDNLNTLSVEACRLKKHPKVALMLEDFKEKAEAEALMSTTEAFGALSKIARTSPNEALRKGAIIDILKAHGIFKPEPGILADTINIKLVRADKRAENNG